MFHNYYYKKRMEALETCSNNFVIKEIVIGFLILTPTQQKWQLLSNKSIMNIIKKEIKFA